MALPDLQALWQFSASKPLPIYPASDHVTLYKPEDKVDDALSLLFRSATDSLVIGTDRFGTSLTEALVSISETDVRIDYGKFESGGIVIDGLDVVEIMPYGIAVTRHPMVAYRMTAHILRERERE